MRFDDWPRFCPANAHSNPNRNSFPPSRWCTGSDRGPGHCAHQTDLTAAARPAHATHGTGRARRAGYGPRRPHAAARCVQPGQGFAGSRASRVRWGSRGGFSSGLCACVGMPQRRASVQRGGPEGRGYLVLFGSCSLHHGGAGCASCHHDGMRRNTRPGVVAASYLIITLPSRTRYYDLRAYRRHARDSRHGNARP